MVCRVSGVSFFLFFGFFRGVEPSQFCFFKLKIGFRGGREFFFRIFSVCFFFGFFCASALVFCSLLRFRIFAPHGSWAPTSLGRRRRRLRFIESGDGAIRGRGSFDYALPLREPWEGLAKG